MVGLKLRPYMGGGTPYTYRKTTFSFCCLTPKNTSCLLYRKEITHLHLRAKRPFRLQTK